MSFARAFLLSLLVHSLLIFAFIKFNPEIKNPQSKHVRLDLSLIRIEKEKKVKKADKLPKKSKRVHRTKKVKKRSSKKTKKTVYRKSVVKRVATHNKEVKKTTEKEERKNVQNTPLEQERPPEKPKVEPVAEKPNPPPSYYPPEDFPVGIGDEDIEEEESYEEGYKEENLNRIREIVQSYLSYPIIARRMGWEGTVVVKFVLTSEGKVREADIEKSSGFEVLDRNALEVIKLASKDFPRPSKDVVVLIPVVYRLEE